MSVPTLDFVLADRAMMLDGLAREVATTKRVLAAVPEGKRDYRPDPTCDFRHLVRESVSEDDSDCSLEYCPA